ncbi:ADP-ribosylation factor isoform X1 [Cucumis melo var. makuwa]|uniref:ADP-ribosylation factor isoform X1 n=1 Tax=Cucumis melo var. makuwa TaxID=1194695 RepID=A0A5A7SNE1_CUCMM|nr:ADP-ribosylation factor isoform X1 [Cucumis melo var. makuwa]TYK09683.1 ADP-ribosylation factor isoform X1 [Cucumis melo var. makuwa]
MLLEASITEDSTDNNSRSKFIVVVKKRLKETIIKIKVKKQKEQKCCWTVHLPCLALMYHNVVAAADDEALRQEVSNPSTPKIELEDAAVKNSFPGSRLELSNDRDRVVEARDELHRMLNENSFNLLEVPSPDNDLPEV